MDSNNVRMSICQNMVLMSCDYQKKKKDERESDQVLGRATWKLKLTTRASDTMSLVAPLPHAIIS